MKRAVFVPYIEAFGGVERLILSLSRWLFAERIEHEIVCFRDTIRLEQFSNDPMSVTQLDPARRNLSEISALRRFAREACWGVKNPPLLFDLKSAFYAALSGLRSYTIHLTDPPSLLPTESSRVSATFRRWAGVQGRPHLMERARGEIVHLTNQRGARNADRIVVMTERIREELAALYGVDGTIVRPGIARKPAVSVRPIERSGSSTKILSISRIEESKRLDEAIRTIANLGSDDPWTLDLVGSGPATDDLRKLASKLGVGNRVKFLGRLSDDQLEARFEQSDIFIMPAVQGYGLPALEALERGLPVVMHRDSGVAEILGDTPWVEVVESCSDLAEALQRIRFRMLSGKLVSENAPHIPYEDDWAKSIAKACSWVC